MIRKGRRALGLGCAKKELEKLRVCASYEELMLSLSAETMWQSWKCSGVCTKGDLDWSWKRRNYSSYPLRMRQFTMDSHFSWQYWVVKLTPPVGTPVPATSSYSFALQFRHSLPFACRLFTFRIWQSQPTSLLSATSWQHFFYFPFLPFQQILSTQHVPHVLLLHVAYLKTPRFTYETCQWARRAHVRQAVALLTHVGCHGNWQWIRLQPRRDWDEAGSDVWRQSRTCGMRKAERGVLSLWQRGYCLASEVFCGLSAKPVASTRQPRGSQAPHLFVVPVAATVPAAAPCHVALECGQSDCDFCCLMHMPRT